MGERTPLAAIDAPASGRMAVAEAITNLLAAPIELARVKLSANWMAACGEPGEDAALYDTVRAVGMELCPALGMSIPVGKDIAVDAHAVDGPETAEPRKKVTSPVSLIVTAFATLADVRGTLTPQLADRRATPRWSSIDLGRGRTAWAAASSRRRWTRCGDTGARPGRPAGPGGAGQRRERAARRRARSSPTTTAATAACSPLPARWPSPATSAWRSTWTCWSPKATASPTAAPTTATPRTGRRRSLRAAKSSRSRRCSTRSSACCCRCAPPSATR